MVFSPANQEMKYLIASVIFLCSTAVYGQRFSSINIEQYKYLVVDAVSGKYINQSYKFLIKNLSKAGYTVISVNHRKHKTHNEVPQELNTNPELGLYLVLNTGVESGCFDIKLDAYNHTDQLVFESKGSSCHLLSSGIKNAIAPYTSVDYRFNPNIDVKESPPLLEIDESDSNASRSDTNNSTTDSPLQTGNKEDSDNIRIRVLQHNDIDNIAVIGKKSTLCDGTEDDGVALGELISGELLGIYEVVERQHLEDILREQKLAMGGLVFEDSEYAKAGCLAGAQGTVVASYGCLQGKTKVQIKLVDCSTANVYWSAAGIDVSEFQLLDALRMELED